MNIDVEILWVLLAVFMIAGQCAAADITARPEGRSWAIRNFAQLSCCISIVGWVFVLVGLVTGGMQVNCDAVQP